MKKQKILFFIENLNIGGAERVFVNLLKEFDREVFYPILVLVNEGNNKRKYKLPSDIEVINLNTNKKVALFPFLKIIKQEKPDIIFSNLAPMNIISIFSKFIIGDRDIKYIIRETTIKSISIDNTKDNIISRILYKFLIKRTYNHSDGIIALSNGTKYDLIQNFGVSKEKIHVIYNPIDIKNIEAASKEEINDIEIRKEYINIICVGSFVKSKGHKYLIKAIKKIKKNYKVRAYFIGTGKLEEELKHLVSINGLDDDIFFLGYKSNPFKYISKCDFLVHPALWEGFGNVIVEAMACNTVVLASDCPSGPREIINNGVSGMIFESENVNELANCIIKLIDNPDYSERLKSSGYIRSKDFDINKITRDYENYILSKLD